MLFLVQYYILASLGTLKRALVMIIGVPLKIFDAVGKRIRSVKVLLRYMATSKFEIAAVRHPGFCRG